MFKKITLKNGLRIITVPQKEAETMTILVLVGTGSKYERKETNGISHFLEHMFFKGTEKKPNTLTIAETLDEVGGLYNAFTSEEYTGYFAKVSSNNFELALDWVSDILLNSKFEENEVEKEKKVIIEEINLRFDHPTSYIGVLWNKLLYGDQPAGWDIAGTKESVLSISREKIIEYLKNQYVASNTVVCLAGKFPEDAPQKIEKYFLGISSEKYLKKEKVIERQERPECLLHERNTDQTHLYLGFRGIDLFHPQRFVLEVLSTLLGGMMSSRLFIEVREKLGLAYYIVAGSSFFTDSGFLVTTVGVDNNRIDLAISTILKEYKKIIQEKIPLSELKKAKENIKGKSTLSLESSDALAIFYGMQELLENKILTLPEIFKEIDKVSELDIIKVAKDIFKPERLNLALIGPYKEKERFEKIIQTF